jgi:hypothetical protein
MKRIPMLLSVVALMVVMLAMSVTPAFAGWVTEPGPPSGGCKEGDELVPPDFSPDVVNGKRTLDDAICQSVEFHGGDIKVHYYDNRIPFFFPDS